MPSQKIFHILALHLYQPPHSLQTLLGRDEDELKLILKSYARIVRYAQKYSNTAQLHIIFSVPLVQQLSDPVFIEQARHLEDIPAMLDAFRAQPNIEIIASGYQHAPLPLIPPIDWEAQLQNERKVIKAVFGQQPKGYFPPGGFFIQEMIPHLLKAGYQYALLPRAALQNNEGHSVDPYRAYQLAQGFVTIPVDEGFSHAQAHLTDAPWFADEVMNGVRLSPESDSAYVIATCSDGENGHWFRRTDEENGYFGHFFAPYMEFCETGEYPVRPINAMKYIQDSNPESATLTLQEKNNACHPILQRLSDLSTRYWTDYKAGVTLDPAIRELILQAEGSCYVLDHDPQLKALAALLDRIEATLKATPSLVTKPATNSDTVGAKNAVSPPSKLAQKPTRNTVKTVSSLNEPKQKEPKPDSSTLSTKSAQKKSVKPSGKPSGKRQKKTGTEPGVKHKSSADTVKKATASKTNDKTINTDKASDKHSPNKSKQQKSSTNKLGHRSQ